MQSLEHERRLAARERQMLAEATAKLRSREQDLKNREEMLRKRLDQKIEERLREARREIDAVVGRLKARTETMATQAERAAARLIPTGETGGGARRCPRGARRNRGSPARSAAAVPGGAVAAPPAPAEPSRLAVAGDRVVVGALGLEGVVLSMQDATPKSTSAASGCARGSPTCASSAAPAARPATVRVNVDLQPREGLLTELNLIGSNVDDALVRAEKFLDDASITEQRTVRLIHGYGTGQLRRALAELLKTHPFVASFGPAPSDKGGGGVTVVELKE